MQFDEEEVEQNELEAPEEMEDTPDGEMADEEAMANKPKAKVMRRPGSAGLWLTIFAAVVVILIGGLASYYYYSFQSQGAGSEQEIKDIWEGTSDATEDLVDAYGRIEKYEDITDKSSASFSVAVDRTNRTIRDNSFDLQNQAGLSIKASTVVSKLALFMEAYEEYLAEMRKAVDRGTEIEEVKELEDLVDAASDTEKAYDSLLQVNNGFLKINIPRTVFDIGDHLSELSRQMLDDSAGEEEETSQAKNDAETRVSQFVQAWQDRDAEGMQTHLTAGGRNDFSPAILEDSVEITGLSINTTEVAEDRSKVTVRGNVKRETPDGTELTEAWQFVLLSNDSKWLIDSWKKI